MVNTRAKGAKAEREYEEILNSEGYITQRVKGSTIFNKNCDFFGYWDIIGFNSDLQSWMLVQVKSNSTGGFLKKGIKWNEDFNPPHCICRLAIRYDNKSKDDRWRVIEL